MMLAQRTLLHLVILLTLYQTYERARVLASNGQVIHLLEDEIGSENFTYFRLQRPGSLRLELVSLKGDVDIYTSTEEKHPDYNTYDLKSDTCGLDIINVPSSMPRPVFISLFGHPNYINSKFRLVIMEVTEAPKEDYEYLVNKYERYYFEEMEQEMSGIPRPQSQKPEPTRDYDSIEDEEEDSLPMWWKILMAILQVGIEAVL